MRSREASRNRTSRRAPHSANRMPSDRADTRQQQAFGEQLANQAATSAADRHADRDLALPRRAARKQQVRHVGASDQQHHAHDRHQNDQRLAVFPAEIGDSVGRGLRIEGLLQVLVPVLRPQLAAIFSFQSPLLESRLINLRRERFQAGRSLACQDAALQASDDLQPADWIEVSIEHALGSRYL